MSSSQTLKRILERHEELDLLSTLSTECKRKGVVAQIVSVHVHSAGLLGLFKTHGFAMNGPMEGHECGGKEAVGSCGCQHAEPFALAKMPVYDPKTDDFQMFEPEYDKKRAYGLIVSYTPCSRCAEVIIQRNDMIDVGKTPPIQFVIARNLTLHDMSGWYLLEENGIKTILKTI